MSNREDLFAESGGRSPRLMAVSSLKSSAQRPRSSTPDGASTEYATLSEAFDHVHSASKIVLQRVGYANCIDAIAHTALSEFRIKEWYLNVNTKQQVNWYGI